MFTEKMVLLIGLLFSLLGCSSHQQPQKVDKYIVNTLPDDYQLHLKSSGARYINDLLVAEVTIDNPTQNLYRDVIYRFKWYDHRGREVAEAFSVWKPLFIEAMDEQSVKAVAPDPKAEEYRFYIKKREGDSSSYVVESVDPGSLLYTDVNYGSEDLHILTEKIVNRMLQDKLFDGNVVILVNDIQNRTDEHIDTEEILDTIESAIIKSERAKFVDGKMRAKLAQELAYQKSSGYVEPTHVKQAGKQLAPQYMLDGYITAIKKKHTNHYQLILKLHNIETGTIDWTNGSSSDKRKRKR